MPNETSNKILYSSGEAAKFVTGIEGWVDRNGRFFGDNEDLARYSGCTHVLCNVCGKEMPVRGYCRGCRDVNDVKKYASKTKVEWDEKTPIYSEAYDEYFFDADSLRDYLEESECSAESLRLVLCEPNRFSEVETDHFQDDFNPEEDLPGEILEALNVFNEVIRSQSPASWSPGKYAIDADGLEV